MARMYHSVNEWYMHALDVLVFACDTHVGREIDRHGTWWWLAQCSRQTQTEKHNVGSRTQRCTHHYTHDNMTMLLLKVKRVSPQGHGTNKLMTHTSWVGDWTTAVMMPGLN